ncbi:aldehyde dehydrogenase family protein [Hoeflea sp. G2-23]|uniref:Aldehyde dehydrogenase family protein n=1 Tax=Hoeflea algicola TaxID=2983763 RepID=A0ABT3Z590_9HYPH|nr:aldehyde dehydrogenase family protein [Hoeflea algicola]MCY0146823.1 aldehyde dehydrogenase family protein [Hoeflea algicola]
MPKIYKNLIGGQWCSPVDDAHYEAVSPATMKVLGKVPLSGPMDIDRAVKAAQLARPVLAAMSPWERSRLCLNIADQMEARSTELAEVLSSEQGKPLLSEAKPEVAKAIQGFREAAEHIKWMEGATISVADATKRVFTFRQPRGVYGVITPWNFPINIPVEYLAPGLVAGNAIVWVPAPTTSICALKVAECIMDAGAPDGSVNVVTGHGPVVGDALAIHENVDGIGFTGSSATGKLIAARAAGKAQLMELGGNGPVIVLNDADLDLAAAAICMGSFVNAGQICSASERVLVDRRVADELTEKIVAIAKGVVLGDPMKANTTMGPLNNRGVASKVADHISEAEAAGARILIGGKPRPELGSDLYYSPTVVTDVPRNSKLAREETFGPVVPLIVCDSIEDIVNVALDDRLGLAASVFTKRLDMAFYFSEILPAGLVNINERSSYWELHIPFGGGAGTDSGTGRIGGKHALEAMSVLKAVSVNVGRSVGERKLP